MSPAACGMVKDWSPFYSRLSCDMQSVIWSMMLHAANVTHICWVGWRKTPHRKDLRCTSMSAGSSLFTRNMHVEDRRHLFVKITLWWSVGDYLERFKRYAPRVAYTRVKYLRVWDITVTVKVDSTEKNRWVTIIVLAWSVCIITNVSAWAKMGEAKTLPRALLTQKNTDKIQMK